MTSQSKGVEQRRERCVDRVSEAFAAGNTDRWLKVMHNAVMPGGVGHDKMRIEKEEVVVETAQESGERMRPEMMERGDEQRDGPRWMVFSLAERENSFAPALHRRSLISHLSSSSHHLQCNCCRLSKSNPCSVFSW